MNNLIEKAEARIKEDKDYLKSVMKTEHYNKFYEGNIKEKLKATTNEMEILQNLKRRQNDILGDVGDWNLIHIERELNFRISLYQIFLDMENELEHLLMIRETYENKFHLLASDIMANRFHPKHFDKWVEWGFDDGFDFIEC